VPGAGGHRSRPRRSAGVAARPGAARHTPPLHQPDYYRRIAGRIYGGAARRDPDALLHGSPARFIERPTLQGYLGQIYAITGWTSLPWLRTLRQPTLVLTGDDDPIVPLVNGRIFARYIPNARLHIVRNGGHLFLLENPAEIAALVAGFLTTGGNDPA
jgi:poly(3-hydroxyoctanoate) depolymerase